MLIIEDACGVQSNSHRQLQEPAQQQVLLELYLAGGAGVPRAGVHPGHRDRQVLQEDLRVADRVRDEDRHPPHRGVAQHPGRAQQVGDELGEAGEEGGGGTEEQRGEAEEVSLRACLGAGGGDHQEQDPADRHHRHQCHHARLLRVLRNRVLHLRCDNRHLRDRQRAREAEAGPVDHLQNPADNPLRHHTRDLHWSLYLNQMESDINYPKSKAFNVFLRFLQLSLSLACTVFLVEMVEHSCRDEPIRTLEMLIAALAAVSLLAIIVVKCSDSHPKVGFFLLFVLEAAAATAIGLLSFMDLKTSSCGFTEQLYVYYIAQCALSLLVILSVLILPLLWIQRFTNSPGNLVWPGLFLYFNQWQGTFYGMMLLIAGLTVLVSTLTFIANVFAGFKGTTTGIKKFIKFAWLFDLVLMLAAEGLAVYAFTLGRSNGHFQSGFSGSKAKMLLQCFILVNLVDLIFWFYGYQSLDYENGDAIRDQLVKFGKNPQFQEESDVQEYGRAQYGQLQ